MDYKLAKQFKDTGKWKEKLNKYIQDWYTNVKEREAMDIELRESEEELFILNCRLLNKYTEEEKQLK